jgi:hypothetical protein
MGNGARTVKLAIYSIPQFFFWLVTEGRMHNLKYDYTFRGKPPLEPPPLP